MTGFAQTASPVRPPTQPVCDPRATDPFAFGAPNLWAGAASRAWISAFQEFAVEASAPTAGFFDALLYDVGRLTEAERGAATELAGAGAQAVLVLHPHAARAPRLYASAAALRAGPDCFAGVVALPEAGVSHLGAVAFGRQVADAAGAPTIVAPPEPNRPDAHIAMVAPGDAEPAEGDATIAGLLAGGFAGARLVVSHGLGGGRFARALHAPHAAVGGDPGRARLLSLAGAPATPPSVRATHVLGALDPYGLWISAPGARIALAPPFAGRHLTPSLPFGLDLAAIVGSEAGRGAPRR